MTLPDLAGSSFCILGMKGSGKTVLLKHLTRAHPRSLIYDTMREYDAKAFTTYIPTHRQYTEEAIREMDLAVNKLVLDNPGKLDLFAIDEANRYCPNNRPMPSTVSYLNDFNRHLNLIFGTIARRPAQLNTDLVELADHLFIFRLVGRNDRGFLEDTVSGLSETVRTLPDYHFVHLNPRRDVQVCKPVGLI